MRIDNMKPGETCQIDVKRFYAPFNCFDDCPKCGKEVDDDQHEYFSYPLLGTPMSIYFYCDCDGGTEWARSIIISVTAEVSQ